MKKAFIKVMALTLALVMVFGVAPSNGFVGLDLFGTAASAASESDLTFTLINDGTEYEVSGCNEGASGELIIPSTYNGLPVTRIGYYAFAYHITLTSITIPDSVTSIDEKAFWGCDSLTGITVSSNNANYSSDSYGVLYNKDKTELIQYPIGNESDSFEIPTGVASIGDAALAYCNNLTSITIPDSVTSIGEGAFYGCELLASITIPDSVTSIGGGAFSFCTNLTSITIPDSVTSIGEKAFSGCESLSSISIGNSVTSIGEYAFLGCESLISITVSSNNANYSSDSYGVLYNKDKTELIQYPIGNERDSFEIPTGVTSIGDYAFDGCTSLTSITIPDSVISIGSYAFYLCNSLAGISIGNSVTSIGEYAFSGCTSLESITIPDSVTSIGYFAFNDCTSLTSITIPDSVTSIGNYAFADCTSLTDVYYSGTEEEWKDIEIGEFNESLTDAEIHYEWGKEISFFQKVINFFLGIFDFFKSLFGFIG